MVDFMYLKDVVTLEIDRDKCVGCGMCLIVCPHAVLSMNNGHAMIKNRDACMECGACQKNCPTDALKVESGVGCAWAIIWGTLTGNEANCDCDRDSKSNNSCC